MRYQKFAKEKHSSLQAAMSHLIRFDGGQEYCTYCGTNDFSTACKYNIDNDEILLRERQLLKKENDLIIKERINIVMSHLIRYDGGQEYCTYCGTNDFSTACNHNINDNNEIVLRERQLLKKENDLIIKERMLSIKMTELAIKEQDLIVTRQAIQFSYATIFLWFLMHLLAIYIVYAGFRDITDVMKKGIDAYIEAYRRTWIDELRDLFNW